LIGRDVQTGVALNTRWNGSMLFRYIDDDIQIGNRSIGRRQFGYSAQFSPSRLVAFVAVSGTTGQEIDFANARPGTGSTVNVSAMLNPTNHLSLMLTQDQSWVNVDGALAASRQLFIARVSRMRHPTHVHLADVSGHGKCQPIAILAVRLRPCQVGTVTGRVRSPTS
jgi:hypothetical protein